MKQELMRVSNFSRVIVYNMQITNETCASQFLLLKPKLSSHLEQIRLPQMKQN